MATEAAVGAIMAATAVTGTAVSIYQAKETKEAQEKAGRTQQAQAELEANKQRQAQLRQARMQRARIQNIAAQTGTSGSAGEYGAEAHIGSQTNANLSFLDQSSLLARQTSASLSRAQSAQTKGQMAGTIAGFATKYADFNQLIDF